MHDALHFYTHVDRDGMGVVGWGVRWPLVPASFFSFAPRSHPNLIMLFLVAYIFVPDILMLWSMVPI